jgi:hypothetical protein
LHRKRFGGGNGQVPCSLLLQSGVRIRLLWGVDGFRGLIRLLGS